LCCVFLFSTLEVFANKIPPQPKQNDGQPGLVLPIDDYIIQVLVIGIILGIYFLKRKKSITQ